MELKQLFVKLGNVLNKYRYAALIFVIGLALVFLPTKNKKQTNIIQQTKPNLQQTIETDALEEVLKSIQGAGNVKVLLSVANGEETIYEKDIDSSNSDGSSSNRDETVLITDAQRAESGLIRQVNPPVYLGAIVVCEGADNATVKLSITQAVSKITGLSTDHICVLKMK